VVTVLKKWWLSFFAMAGTYRSGSSVDLAWNSTFEKYGRLMVWSTMAGINDGIGLEMAL